MCVHIRLVLAGNMNDLINLSADDVCLKISYNIVMLSCRLNVASYREVCNCMSVCVCCCSNRMNDFEKQENFIREILAPAKEFWTSDVCRE